MNWFPYFIFDDQTEYIYACIYLWSSGRKKLKHTLFFRELGGFGHVDGNSWQLRRTLSLCVTSRLYSASCRLYETLCVTLPAARRGRYKKCWKVVQRTGDVSKHVYCRELHLDFLRIVIYSGEGFERSVTAWQHFGSNDYASMNLRTSGVSILLSLIWSASLYSFGRNWFKSWSVGLS